MILLDMKDIKKSFGGTEILHGISLQVHSGEVLAVIGPSGSGKSTLLRCATLLEHVDSGEIRYLDTPMVTTGADGRAVYAKKKDLQALHAHFGLVFQSFFLFPHLSVRQNITGALLHVRKMKKAEANAIAEELLRKVGLAEKADAYPGQLSGGQQQRVSIARALALKPDVLFFDEPTSALDPELTGEILKVIQALADEKMTMVIVTHEMNFARMAANRVIFMDAGAIIEQGETKAVFANPQSERTKEFLRDWSR